jgi:ribose transport system permease protein
MSVAPPTFRLARLMADNPLLPLTLLLAALILALEVMQPGIVNPRWIGNTVKFAIPLAMLAACQTMTMLTGGIDLSAGTTATIAAFVTATLAPIIGVPAAVATGLACALVVGLVNGFGVAVCRVHPLIMTLGTALIGNGCLLVYQRFVIATGTLIPEKLVWLGTGRTWGMPNGLVLFVPFAALILWGERRTGFGRLLYAMGSNEAAARLSGVRGWQVLLALYALSGVVAGLTGLLYLGLV